MLTEANHTKYLMQMQRIKSGNQENNAASFKLFKTILDLCKDSRECRFCGNYNGVVKKLQQ